MKKLCGSRGLEPLTAYRAYHPISAHHKTTINYLSNEGLQPRRMDYLARREHDPYVISLCAKCIKFSNISSLADAQFSLRVTSTPCGCPMVFTHITTL